MNMKELRDKRWEEWSKPHGVTDRVDMYMCWCTAWNHALGAAIASMHLAGVDGIASNDTPKMMEVFKAARGEQE